MQIADLKFKVDKEQLDQAKDSVKDLGKEIPGVGNQVDMLGKAFDKLNNPLTIAIGLFTLAAGAMVKMGLDAINAADDLNDLSIASGQASEDIQALGEIAKKSGGDLDALMRSQDKLSVKMVENSKDFQAALKYFGVSLTDTDGKMKSVIQLQTEVATAYENTVKTTNTQAAAQEILGKSFRDQIPTLLEANKLEAEKKKLYEDGAIVSDALKKASDEYNDSLVDVNSIQQGLGNFAAEVFLPVLKGMVEWFIKSAKEGGMVSWVLEGIKFSAWAAAQVLSGLGQVLIGLDATLQILVVSGVAAWNILKKIATGDFSGAADTYVETGKKVDVIKLKAREAAAELRKMLEPTEGGDGPPLRPDTGLSLGGNGKPKGAKTAKDKKEDTDWIKQQQKDINDLQGDIAKAQQAEEKRLDGLARKYRDLIDPLQKYRDAEAEIEELYKAGKISADEMTEALFRNADAMMDAAFKNEKSVEKQKGQYEELVQAVEGYTQKMSDSFIDFVATGKGSFKDLMSSILVDLAKMLANSAWKELGQKLGGSGEGGGWGGLISKGIDWLMSSNGNVFSGGSLVPYSVGGVVDTPSTFPMANGGTGLMAEANPEAIMPLKRLPSGRMGVETTGMGGGGYYSSNQVVIQNINVKAEEGTDGNKVGRQVADQIKSIVLQTLNNERRPGNSMNPVAANASF